MNPRSLQAVLRSLSGATSATEDGELLRRFVGGEEGAFGELVRRHGRLVWAVCRHLSRSDAEADDAFQATFLVLFQNAAKVRDAGRLSAWLHGVAYRICAKARQAAKRRAIRERAAATGERNGSVVADSAWDRALAAVHEEAGRLPESLRVPFVLCCLEGIGVTEAAAQLGWKLGTLSGRLTRAKDAVLARLDARGLTIGAVAGLGLAAPPAAVAAKAIALVRAGAIVPNSILQLTQGVIGMKATSFKLLAAAVFLACGLGVGAGSGWMATAGAQTPTKPAPAKPDPQAEVNRLAAQLEEARRLQAELESARRDAQYRSEAARAADLLKQARAQQEIERQRAEHERAMLLAEMDLLAAAQKTVGETPTARTGKWEYDFVAASDMDQAKFVKLLQDREASGWEFTGATPLLRGGKRTDTWVFRRLTKGAVGQNDYSKRLVPNYQIFPTQRGTTPPAKLGDVKPDEVRALDEARALEADIARLQEKLAALKRKPTHDRVVYPKKELPLEPAELSEILLKLAGKKFKDAHYTFTPNEVSLVIEGDRAVIDWAMAMIKKLSEK